MAEEVIVVFSLASYFFERIAVRRTRLLSSLIQLKELLGMRSPPSPLVCFIPPSTSKQRAAAHATSGLAAAHAIRDFPDVRMTVFLRPGALALCKKRLR